MLPPAHQSHSPVSLLLVLLSPSRETCPPQPSLALLPLLALTSGAPSGSELLTQLPVTVAKQLHDATQLQLFQISLLEGLLQGMTQNVMTAARGKGSNCLQPQTRQFT